MNLSLHDPFTLAQDSPETLVNDLRSGHATTLRFNRKGDYLASGRVDGKVVIWDMETMGVAMKLHGHWKQVQSLSWSRDGRYLLTASQDCRVCLWDLQTQDKIRTAKFQSPIYLAEMHPYNHNLCVVSIFDDHPCLVDVSEPIAKKMRLPTTPQDIEYDAKHQTSAAIFSTMGGHIITGTTKGYINILETSTRKIIHSTKLSSGLISLLRLTTNGRQMLVNSTDRIIRVVDMPDLSVLRPVDAGEEEYVQTEQEREDAANGMDAGHSNGPDPGTLAENIHLNVSHKFQDLVNRLRWNDCAFSHSSSASLFSTSESMGNNSHATADYITASTYMKRDIYIWELRTSSLLRILENAQEPAIIEWHPTRPLLACTSIETGSIQIWGIEPQQKWSALAPDFEEVEENVEYIEREDEFDILPEGERVKRRGDEELANVDVLGIGDTATKDDAFVLPMLYDIEDSDADDQELIRMGVGTLRKKEVNEGKEYEDDGEGTPNHTGPGNGKRPRRK